MKVSAYKIIFVIIFLVIIAEVAFLLINKPTQLSENKSFAARRSEISSLIDREGGSSAYKTLITNYKNSNLPEAHSSIHLFGELIYKKEGIKSIHICDTSFAYACFHGVFIAATLDRGLGIVEDLGKVCDKYFPEQLDCHHGIGHGILEYLGHEKLNEALRECDKFEKPQAFGCQNGVFMEYNFPAIQTPQGYQPTTKDFNQSSAYSTCLKIDAKYEKSCYYSLPQWWRNVLNNDYRKMDNLCMGIVNINNRQSCYVGLGSIAVPYTEKNISKIFSICDSMSDELGKKYCYLGAYWSLGKSKGNEICLTLSGKYQTKCSYSFEEYIKN